MSGAGETKRGLFGRLFGGRSEPEKPVAEPLPDAAVETADDGAEADAGKGAGAEAKIEVASGGEPARAEPVSAPPVEPEAEPAGVEVETPIRKAGWFQRLKSGLAKTSSRLAEGITGVFTKRRLDDDTLEELEDLLIQADLGVDAAQRITAKLKRERYNKDISADEVKAVLASEVEAVLAPVAKPLAIDRGLKPQVILMVGVNGTGKTTTIGKLASRYRKDGLKVMMAAGDTFRAAAIDQLKIWGERTGAEVMARDVGADSSGLAFDAMTAARETGSDVLLIDTAGRLQNKAGLMAELEKIVRVIRKVDPSAPHDVLLVLDATTGQNAVNQVEVFRTVAGVTGLVMTKLDGTARGGILVAVAERFGLPIHAIGVGEGAEDLQAFDAAEFARAIAGN
ncbi:MAG: signal recognition particle-docking protein FtsY [Hyphomicrobiaceae bacterium]